MSHVLLVLYLAIGQVQLCNDPVAMVTAAVLGAAVGVGAALVLTLTLLIYRYHAAQKKEAADCHYQGNSNSWSTRDSWAPAPTAPPAPPSYKSTSCLLETPNGRRRPAAKLYLPLDVHHQVSRCRNNSFLGIPIRILLYEMERDVIEKYEAVSF